MKRTKTKLVSSIVTLLICFAMLIGSTFAWFTDSASTGVNKIQAGNLDVALEMVTSIDESGNKIWESAEGKTLEFKKASNAQENEIVLWEPGCTYELPELRIINNGSLALKYRIQITGITGNAKLLEVINFTYGNDVDINSEIKLAPHQSTEGIVLKGHMIDSAGNDYQGLTLDNIAITVIATQDTVETDSFDKYYDKDAIYPTAPVLNSISLSGNITVSNGGKLGDISSEYPTAAQIEVPVNAVASNKNAKFAMEKINSDATSVTYEISLKEINDGVLGNSITLSAPAKVTANIGPDLVNVGVLHSGVEMREDAGNSGDDETFNYNRNTGILTIYSTTFSPFEINYEYDGVALLNNIAYPTIQSAIGAAKDGETIKVLKDISTDSLVISLSDNDPKDITINLDGKTIVSSFDKIVQVTGNNSNLKITNGNIKHIASGAAIFVSDGGPTLSLDNLTITSNKLSLESRGIASNIEITKCNITSNYFGIYQNGLYGGNNISVIDSTITDNSDESVGIYVSGNKDIGLQNLIVENSIITGETAIEAKHSNVTVTGSTLNATQNNVSYNADANNGSATVGYCLAITSNGIADLTRGKIVLSNNTYNPVNPGCEVFNASGTNGATIEGYDNAHILSPEKLVPVCRISETNTVYYSAYDLSNALAKTLKNKTVILQSDEILNNEIYLSGKVFTLDLNGHSLTLEYGEGITPNNGSVIFIAGKNSKLTITDSSEEQTGSVYGSDKNYSNIVTSAVRVGNNGKLIINGGNFYGMSQGTSCIYVYTSRASSTYATVTINGGYFETKTPYSGTYYVLNHEDSYTRDCKMTINGGNFKNYNPGVTSVDKVNAYTGKIVLGLGCTTSSETSGSDTYYTVTKS